MSCGNTAVIRLVGNQMDVSSDGDAPLPASVLRELQRPLIYTHNHYVHSHRFGSRGGDIISEHRAMFRVDNSGRLVCDIGWKYRISKILEGMGYTDIVEVRLDDVPEWDDTQHWDDVKQRFRFRPHQLECLERIAASDRGVIDAVPAFGKMWLIWMTCVLFKFARIDIVTKRRDVVASIVRLGYRFVSDIGQVGGGKRRKGRVTVYTADSLKHTDGKANILLVDEVHELMTDRYYDLLLRYKHARAFGFTATKETRTDNAHRRMEGMFGRTIFKLSHQEAVRSGLVVPMVVQWLDVPHGPDLSTISSIVMKTRTGIWRNEHRNRIIADAASLFVNMGMQTLILVDTFEHLLQLRKFLPQFECCYSKSALGDKNRREALELSGALDGLPPMTTKLRDELRQRFENREFLGAIATGVWSVGVSFDSLQVLIRAAGGVSLTNSIQMPGRVGRLSPTSGKECGVLIDFLDQFDRGMAGKARRRMKAYRDERWLQYDASGNVINNSKRRTQTYV